MGGKGEMFSIPSALAQALKELHACLCSCPRGKPQSGWCAPHGLYPHLKAVPVSKLVC